MAVNRFDKPVESQYISQYVPIPFEQLYKVGKEYNDRVEAAYNTINEQLNKWKEFRSPSAVDTQAFYDLTLKPAQELVNKFAANPDLIKTQAGRTEIQQFINSRPYGELSNLQQSRDAMLQRQKLEQQLSLAGKYNPLWHGMDYTNYDTSSSGIMNDLNLIPYKSEVDLVKPYVDNLKPSYLYSKNGYDYSGVSTDTTDEMVKRNLSSIYNTPEAQMHINALMKQGLTREQANEQFINSIYLAGREFAYENREANAFELLNQRLINSRKNVQGKDQNYNRPFYLTQSIEATGLYNYLKGKQNIITNNDKYASLYEQSKSSDPKVREAANKEINRLVNSTPTELFRSILDSYGTVDKDGRTTLNQVQLNNGVNDILNNFSVPVKGGELQSLLSSTIDGISTDTQDTPLGKRKIITGGQNMNLMSRIIAGIAGFNPKEPETVKSSRNKVLNNLKAGNFTNMILLSNDRVLTVPTMKDGQISSLNVLQVNVAVSDDDIKKLGLTDLDMQKAGARKINISGNQTQTTTLSGDVDSDNEYNYDKTTTSTTKKQDQTYWQLTLGNEIPTEGTSAEYLNQAALKQNISSTAYTQEYPNVQNEAFTF